MISRSFFALAACAAIVSTFGLAGCAAPSDAGVPGDVSATDVVSAGDDAPEAFAYGRSPESALASRGLESEADVLTPRGMERVHYQDIDGDAVADGDIVLGPTKTLAAGNVNLARRWPGGIVPYRIDPTLPNPSRVETAMEQWRTRVGLTFVVRSDETAFVTFRPGSGCSSHIGRIGGEQFVNLAPGCRSGTVIHEIGHAIGLWHEQSRSDRDLFVTVILANVQPGLQSNFNKMTVTSLGAYDYGSIMHYGSYDFSTNGQPTLTKIDGTTIVANRTALSTGDIEAVQLIYASESLTPLTPPTTATTTSQLNLRSGPGLGFSILTSMPKGTTVTRTGSSQNGFEQVVYGTLTGWASLAYLTTP